MSESKFAAVSLCMDNESRNEQDLNNIINDAELSDSWSRYQLIGDVMRNEVPDEIQLDLSQSIADALEDEVTVLAPIHKTSLNEKMKAKVIQFSKPFGQMAIAASAAGLMIFGVQQNTSDTDMSAPNQVIQTNPFGGVASPVSYNFSSQERVNAEQTFLKQQKRFQSLLSDYNQQVKFNARPDIQSNAGIENIERNLPDNTQAEGQTVTQ